MPFSGELTIYPSNMGQGMGPEWKQLLPHSLQALPPGSPEWWLGAGLTAIQAKQEVFAYKEMYTFGPHPAPNGDHRYVRALHDLQSKTKTNYIQLVVNSPVQRMRVKGFRFGETKADEDARLVWMANDMDYQMESFLMDAAIYGESFLLVSEPDEDTGEPVITAESARVSHVFPDPVRPTRALAAIRTWKDVFLQRIIAVVYLPGVDYVWLGPKNTEADYNTMNSIGSYELVAVNPNPLGEVPLVRTEWRSRCRGEADDVFSVQDRINHTILDRLVISKAQAYNQRWVTGSPGINKDKKSKNNDAPFDPGADMLWAIPSPDAKFGQFEAADIKQLLEAIRDDVIDMASLTQTPAHYLMGKMQNVSGDTLTQAESGFVAKVKMRQRSVGWGIEKAMKLAFAHKGQMDKATSIDAEVIWQDPEVRNRAELADAALKEAQVFSTAPPFAIPVIAERMGLEPDQIEELVAAAEEWQQEQQQREEQMLEKQNEGMLAVAKEGGKARAATTGSKSSGTTPKKK